MRNGRNPDHQEILALARCQAAVETMDPVQRDRILRFGAPVGREIEHHRRLDRCMDRLRRRLHEAGGSSPASGLVIRADTLTGSRGRFQRSWFAPPGGLHLALLWADTLLPRFSRLLPFAVGLACCETVRGCGVDARLQWVNDVRVSGRKIAGILCETEVAAGEWFHLIGIGINVNVIDFPSFLAGQATSIERERGGRHDLNQVFHRLLARLIWNLGLLHQVEALWLEQGGSGGEDRLNPLLRRWLALSDTMGCEVEYGFDVQQQPLYRARARGIDNRGGLILERGNGARMVEYSGEIRVVR